MDLATSADLQRLPPLPGPTNKSPVANRPARNPPRGAKERAHREARTSIRIRALNVPLRQKQRGLKPPRRANVDTFEEAARSVRLPRQILVTELAP
jgi:hypothetical protein